MHDWTLIDICYLWEKSECILKLKNQSSVTAIIKATDVTELHIPHASDWGPSVSVNTVTGPVKFKDAFRLQIEMQSGDLITLIANEINMPV
jgi:hypothetical protein